MRPVFRVARPSPSTDIKRQPSVPLRQGRQRVLLKDKMLTLLKRSMTTAAVKLYVTHNTQYREDKDSTGAKTIDIFRACLGAQLTVCAQK